MKRQHTINVDSVLTLMSELREEKGQQLKILLLHKYMRSDDFGVRLILTIMGRGLMGKPQLNNSAAGLPNDLLKDISQFFYTGRTKGLSTTSLRVITILSDPSMVGLSRVSILQVLNNYDRIDPYLYMINPDLANSCGMCSAGVSDTQQLCDYCYKQVSDFMAFRYTVGFNITLTHDNYGRLEMLDDASSCVVEFDRYTANIIGNNIRFTGILPMLDARLPISEYIKV